MPNKLSNGIATIIPEETCEGTNKGNNSEKNDAEFISDEIKHCP